MIAQNQTQNRKGEWVPSIPLPIYPSMFAPFGGKVKCGQCGEKFWTTKLYRGHYALEHILELD